MFTILGWAQLVTSANPRRHHKRLLLYGSSWDACRRDVSWTLTVSHTSLTTPPRLSTSALKLEGKEAVRKPVKVLFCFSTAFRLLVWSLWMWVGGAACMLLTSTPCLAMFSDGRLMSSVVSKRALELFLGIG